MKWIEILRVNQRAQNRRICMEFSGRRKWDIPELVYKKAPWSRAPQCQFRAASKITWTWNSSNSECKKSHSAEVYLCWLEIYPLWTSSLYIQIGIVFLKLLICCKTKLKLGGGGWEGHSSFSLFGLGRTQQSNREFGQAVPNLAHENWLLHLEKKFFKQLTESNDDLWHLILIWNNTVSRATYYM